MHNPGSRTNCQSKGKGAKSRETHERTLSHTTITHFTKNQAFFPLRSTRLKLGFFRYFFLRRDLAEARALNGTLRLDQLRAATTSRSNRGPRICTIRFRLSPGNHPELLNLTLVLKIPHPHTQQPVLASRRVYCRSRAT